MEASLCSHASSPAARSPSLAAALTNCLGSSSQKVEGVEPDIGL